jgi:antitoxin ParD1/3/4
MSRTQTVSLGGYWNNYIESMLESGRYASISELMRDSLRLLEEKEASSQLKVLRSALIAGEESGSAGILNMVEIKKKVKKKL